jgi:hypothetical protein
VLEKSREEVVGEVEEKELMLREKSRELCRREELLVLYHFPSWNAPG